MTTYRNTGNRSNLPCAAWDDSHDWREFTERRLIWLYGPNHRTERAAQTASDLEAWRNLGSPTRPAA